MATDFGTGPVLTRDFDLEISRDGDIKTNEDGTDTEELQKDLGLIVANHLEPDGLGQLFTRSEEEDIRIDLVELIQDDPRIDSVTRSSIEQDSDDNFKLNVEIDVDSSDGPFDLVIPIS